MNVQAMLRAVDKVFGDLLGKLECTDSSDATLIAHWQPDGDGPAQPSYRIQVSRKSDGKTMTRCVHADGSVTV